MRDLHTLDHLRRIDQQVIGLYGNIGDHGNGVFSVASPIDNKELVIVASCGAGWEHVSVSRANRCPNWREMSHIHSLFFGPDEVAMQLHVPAKDHINFHPYCLHIWRPLDQAIPLPPKEFVA